MKLGDHTIRFLRRLEETALEVLRKHGTSRHALAKAHGASSSTVNRHLDPDRPAGETTSDPVWAFRAMEFCGIDPIEVVSGLCPGATPEVILSVMPIPGLDPAEERRARRRQGHKTRLEFLRAAERLEESIPRGSAAPSKTWPVRRSDPELASLYDELEELDHLRHRDREAVERRCEQALTEGAAETELPDALRRAGMVGVWAVIQRSNQRLEMARDALVSSIRMARKLGDEAILATQLRRSAVILDQLGAKDLAVSTLQDVMERCLADKYSDGVGYALVNRAAMAGNNGEIELAERLYLAGRDQLTTSASPFYLIAIGQGVAACRDHVGDVDAALAFLASTAYSRASYDHPILRAALLLTAANIERKLGNVVDAEDKYREALANLEGLGYIEEELKVWLDLSLCLLKSGQLDQLRRVRVQVEKLLPKLRNRRRLQSLCELLILELTSGFVGLEPLQEIRAQL